MDQDLKQLIEELDKKISSVATKSDLQEMEERVDAKFERVDDQFKIAQERVDDQFKRAFEVFATKEDLNNLEEKVDGLREMMQVLVSSVDKIVKELSDLRIEYHAVNNQLTRHEKWIQVIAEKVGIKLAF